MTKIKERIGNDQQFMSKVLSMLPVEKQQAFTDAVAAMNDMVNHIENSGNVKTTKNWYGNYLPIITSKSMMIVALAAGADKLGVQYAAQINGIV